MIPIPKLDDRTYADIMAEALRLIPRYAPEWTNHNPSDPGITILELTAWMTELLLYRINRVPEKNYVAFLNMLGIRLRPPQPARALVTFELVEGAERQVITEGMQIATAQAADDDAVVFETQHELVLVGARLDRAFSYYSDDFSDNSPYLLGGREGGFLAFGGGDHIDRFLYLADPRFETLATGALLHLHVSAPERGGRDLARLLEWEYWNGRRWRELKQVPTEVERGEVVFSVPADLSPAEVNGLTDLWIRGRLAEVPENPWETEIDTVRVVVEVAGEGTQPDVALANLEGGLYRSLDLTKNFSPLGSQPRIDDCLYLASRELFSQAGSEVRVEVHLSDPSVHPAPGPSPDLVISWEYFDGRKWRNLGKTTPRGAMPSGDNPWAFVDSTNALTQTGAISFRVPTDISPGEVNGEDNYWVRLRIDAGDFGQNGSYILDGDRWVWRDERPLRPPGLKSMAILYRADLGYPRRIASYNDFLFRDHSEEAKVEYRPFQPFAAVAEEGPALYLGWDRKLPNDPLSIYVQLADVGVELADDSVRTSSRGPRGSADLAAEALDRPDEEWLRRWYAERDAAWEAEQRVLWEYFDGKQWVPLVVIDGTKNLTQSGFLEFVGPEDMAPSIKFTEERHWLRARLEMGGYVRPPRIQRILANTVEAANVITLRDEVMGSSDGTPAQSFLLGQGPVLGGEVIEVLEKETPSDDERFQLGEGAIRANPFGEGWWVRWRAVESFFDSSPRSRHYLRDGLTRRITFGDGQHGMVPPPAQNGIVARRYQIGGGVRGNVNAFTLTQPTRAVAYVERCYNAMAAAGGADAETIEEAKARAPMMLKSRDRAVTAEDFESLALRASTAVARAKCLPSRERDGEVRVVILPRGEDRGTDLLRKLVPAPELLRHVKNYLDERRLVATVVQVEKPLYAEISLRVSILRRTIGQSDRLKREIEDRLRRFLHPLIGGKDGDGWPFGRSVYKSDLAHLVEDIPGLETVDEITIYDEDRRVAVEAVRLEPGDLVHLVNVVVVERVREEIV
jgi:predicted phage baseplate assembly protein